MPLQETIINIIEHMASGKITKESAITLVNNAFKIKDVKSYTSKSVVQFSGNKIFIKKDETPRN